MSEHPQTADLVLRTMQTGLVQLPPGSVVLTANQVERIGRLLLKQSFCRSKKPCEFCADARDEILALLSIDRKADEA